MLAPRITRTQMRCLMAIAENRSFRAAARSLGITEASLQRAARSLEDKAAAARLVEKMVLPGFVSGDLSVFVAAAYPLDAVADAYERFQAGRKLGKIVLLV